MKLFLIHCGYYDEDTCSGIYENHINLFSIGETIEEAKGNVRQNPLFQKKKMHIDGIQEVKSVNGYVVKMEKRELQNSTEIQSHLHRDL